jgi:methyltransferase
MTADWIILLIVFGSMAMEAIRAARNERVQRARGAVEPAGDVYGAMRLAYPASFAAMLAEGMLRGDAPATFASGALVFAAAKLLKWWAIVALGSFWTFRVMVIPGATLVARGPYRWLRHPNYVGVAGELAGVALMTGAVVSGPVALVGFGLLLIQRIRVEERALATASAPSPASK